MKTLGAGSDLAGAVSGLLYIRNNNGSPDGPSIGGGDTTTPSTFPSSDASWPISGACASGTTTTAGAGGALSSSASGATGTSLGVSPNIVVENWTTRLMVPTDGGGANLSLFLGGAAANHTDEDFPPGCIFYKTTKGRGSPKRLYLSKEYTDSKVSIDALKKVIQESAMRSNVALNAGLRNEKCANKTYQRIYFYCPHKKNCNCKMHFTLNYDPEMSRWYLISGSGHPEHIPHERGQPPRKNAKRKLTQVALEQQGLASSDFGGDAATQDVVAAAAVAAFKPKTKESGEGTCFLCHPFVMGKPNEVLVTCA